MMLRVQQASWQYQGVQVLQHNVMDSFHPVEIKQSHNITSLIYHT